MKTRHAVFFLALFLGAAAVVARAEPPTIYGSDDRAEICRKDARIQRLARSTAALFEAKNVSIFSGKARLKLKFYLRSSIGSCSGKSLEAPLCPEVRFRGQKEGGFCSGFLVAPDIVATAGHCLEPSSPGDTYEKECEGTKFVFDFAADRRGGKTPSVLPASDVYGCKSVIGWEYKGADCTADFPDWTLVRLDRPVLDREPLALDPDSDKLKVGTPVFVIGYPEGLPEKEAGNARVLSVSFPTYFEANLDILSGNSGSPVFNGDTGLVEGIVDADNGDYVFNSARGCLEVKDCPDGGCQGGAGTGGNDETFISEVIPHIPRPAAVRKQPLISLVPPGLNRFGNFLDSAAVSFDSR